MYTYISFCFRDITATGLKRSFTSETYTIDYMLDCLWLVI